MSNSSRIKELHHGHECKDGSGYGDGSGDG